MSCCCVVAPGHSHKPFGLRRVSAFGFIIYNSKLMLLFGS